MPVEASFQGPVRRSLRPMNRQPLYDMTLHPQDEDLAELEEASSPPSDIQVYVDDDEDQVRNDPKTTILLEGSMISG